jgi:putative DNA primase/helicase
MDLSQAATHPLFRNAGMKIKWASPQSAALSLGKTKGWRLVPLHSVKDGVCSCGCRDPKCNSRGKHSRITKWPENAASDAGTLRSWFESWPEANLGQAMGNGMVGLDFDPRHGGLQSLARLEADYGPLPATLKVVTHNGGFHLRFLTLFDFPNKHLDGFPGIDIRSAGGLMVCPPSWHYSGAQYQFENYALPVAEIPVWLLDLLTSILTSSPKKKSCRRTKNQHAEKVPEGERHDDAVSRAGSMRRRGFSGAAIFSALKSDNEDRYAPPLDDDELRDIAFDVAVRYEPVVEDVPGRVLVTEESNAERLLTKYSSDLKFAADRQTWIVWNGRLWNVADTGAALRMVADVVRQIYYEAAGQPTDDLRMKFAAWATKSESHHVQEHTLMMARKDKRVEILKFMETFDCYPLLLNFRNGTYELDRGRFREHRREDFLTKALPFDYDAGARCPTFWNFLADALPDEAVREYFRRFIRLCLSGDTSAQSWWMAYGPTASGKSTALSILRSIMGPYAAALPENYFLINKNQADYFTGNLQGVRLTTAVETGETRTLDVAKVKALTGQDVISAQRKYEHFFDFRPEMKLILATNHRPRIPSTDESIWRRVKVIGFNYTVPPDQRVENLAATIAANEAAGIVNWAIGAQGKISDEPEAVRRAVNEYRSAEDVVNSFLTECTERIPGARSSVREICRVFNAWAEAEGVSKLSKKKLTQEMLRLGVERDSLDASRFWIGINICSGVEIGGRF